MRTQGEIQTKLVFLQAQLANFQDPAQIKQVKAAISMLQWVLGIGPDVVFVPKVVTQ